jgi:hypothetical protein
MVAFLSPHYRHITLTNIRNNYNVCVLSHNTSKIEALEHKSVYITHRSIIKSHVIVLFHLLYICQLENIYLIQVIAFEVYNICGAIIVLGITRFDGLQTVPVKLTIHASPTLHSRYINYTTTTITQ